MKKRTDRKLAGLLNSRSVEGLADVRGSQAGSGPASQRCRVGLFWYTNTDGICCMEWRDVMKLFTFSNQKL